jgi:osmotically-inducible protein OsmY
VTVTGTVDSQAQRDRILRLARETQGVKEVVDRITVR